MKLTDFNYEFPEELVAQHPLPSRTSSKMMVIDRMSGKWTHSHVTDLPSFLKPGDVFVVNDSRVIPARIFGNLKGGKPIELLLVDTLHPNILPLCKGELEGVDNTDNSRSTLLDPPLPFDLAQGRQREGTTRWRCIIKRARNYYRGDKFFFGVSATADVVGQDGDFLVIEFPKGHSERAIERCGVPPLPPYIKRKDYKSYSEEDRERYQTIYANESGSVAAPTAGLHFTEDLIKNIESKGIRVAKVTLHVGADTFAPVRVDDINDHKMHGEAFSISEETAETINCAKKEKRRVIAVGTTTVRALESSCRDGKCHAGKRETSLFITPEYKFQVVDALLTNFHQPKSTLLMLVSAFAGCKLVLSAYQEAIKNRYRLFSYGDCMLIV